MPTVKNVQLKGCQTIGGHTATKLADVRLTKSADGKSTKLADVRLPKICRCKLRKLADVNWRTQKLAETLLEVEWRLKKRGVLNEHIAAGVAGLGHMDQIIICDAGFPSPRGVDKIDLAVSPGIPSFRDTLKAILSELMVEKVILASETEQVSPNFYHWLRKVFVNQEFQFVSHPELKELAKGVKFIVRTGEFIPYANVLLVSASQAQDFNQGYNVDVE